MNKKGISLIVLVITIIVMIILASAIIITLADNGIIEKANEAVQGMNETQVREMANLAWAEAYLNAKTPNSEKTDEWYKEQVINYLNNNGIDTDKYEIDVDDEGVNEVEFIGGSKPTGELNEYGFYYNTFYTADVTYNKGAENERVVKYGVVFYEENNEVALFMDMYNDLKDFTTFSNLTLTNPAYFCVGVSNWTYNDGKVSFADPAVPSTTLTAEFAEDGLTAECSGGPLDGAVGRYSSIKVESPKFNQKYAITFEDERYNSEGQLVPVIFHMEIYTTIDGDMIGKTTITEKADSTKTQTETYTYKLLQARADNHWGIADMDGQNVPLMFTPDGKIALAAGRPLMLTDQVVE